MRGLMIATTILMGLVASEAAVAQGYYERRMYDEDRRPPPRYLDDGPRYGRGYGPPPPPPPPAYGPQGYGPRGGGGDVCAAEGGFCNFRGVATVRYGARGRYVERRARDGIPCNNNVFGDPAPGIPKRCVIDD